MSRDIAASYATSHARRNRAFKQLLERNIEVVGQSEGCIARAALVDHDCVRARVVGNGSAQRAAAWRMADSSNVRHDTIVVPETVTPAQVRALAQRKAQAQVGDDDAVAFLHLHGSQPVGGEHGTEVEWRYSYQVIAAGGAATDTAG